MASIRATSGPAKGVSATSTPASITIPAAAVVGDLLVLAVTYASGNTAPALTGWTQRTVGERTGGSEAVAIYTRTCQSGDAGSTVTVPISSGNAPIAFMWDVQSVHTTPVASAWSGGVFGTSESSPSGQAGDLFLANMYSSDQTSTTYSGGSQDASNDGTGNDGLNMVARHNASSSVFGLAHSTNTTLTLAVLGIAAAQAPSNPGAFTNPTAGQVVNTNDTLAWGASSDPEGGTVTYSVDYSGDGGSTWTNIGSGISGTSYTYDFSGKTATTTAKVRVKAHSSASGLDSGYTTSSTFTVQHNSAPAAPTLTGPANGAYVDVSGGVAITGTYNSTDGTNANARAARFKASGAGSYSYFNAANNTAQSTPVWNTVNLAPGAAGSFTLPAALVANGSVYNWSLADQESGGSLQGPFATDSAFTAQAAPALAVNAPTGTTPNAQPLVSWTTTPAAGTAQTAYRVVVYPASVYSAGGFTPGQASGAAWDSGTVASASQSVQVGAALTNQTTYRAYVLVTETGPENSQWQYVTFTVSFDPPAVPVVTAAPGTDSATGQPRVDITVQGQDNVLTANQASMETDATGWAAGANTTVAQGTTWALDGSYSLKLTATAAGSVTATLTPGGTSAPAVTPNAPWRALVVGHAAATPRNCTLTINWLKADGTASSVRATDSVTFTDSTAAGGTQGVLAVTSPSDAARATTTYTVAGCGAGEVHQADEFLLAPGTSTTWTRGGVAGVTTAEIQYSDDGGATWTDIRNGADVTLAAPTQSASAHDYESTLGQPRQYRAIATAVVGGTTFVAISAYASAAAATDGAASWLADPTDPTTAVSLPVRVDAQRTRPRPEGVFDVLGASTATVIQDVRKAQRGTITFLGATEAQRAALYDLLDSGKTLLLRKSPDPGETAGQSIYLLPTGDVTEAPIGPKRDAHRDVSTAWVGQSQP